MRFVTTLLIVIILLVGSRRDATAQTASCGSVSTEAALFANNVRAKIINNGGLFWNGGRPIYDVGGSGPIFSASIWLAGLIDGDLHAAGSTYGPFEFWPGPADSMRAGIDCERFNRMYTVSVRDIEALDEGRAPSQDVIDWPWRQGAPVVDGDGIAGNYDLAGGDRPELLGSQMVYWIMNDMGGEHHRTDRPPLGVDVHVTAFAAESHDPIINSSTFYRYRIINRNERPIDDMYFGMFMDPDLGAAYDDYVGSDTLAHLAFAYNADDFDDDHYGTAPPAIGIRMFEGPEATPDGYDNDHDGEVDELSERLGMSAFVTYSGSGGAIGDPNHGFDMYNLMRGLWLDGLPITEGGFGRETGTRRTRFMYSGDPPNYWSEFDVDDNGTAMDPADRRFVQSMGPFRLEPGEEAEIFLGFLYARGSDHLDSVSELKSAAMDLKGLRPANVRTARFSVTGRTPRLLTPGDRMSSIPLDAPLLWSRVDQDRRYELRITNRTTGITETRRFTRFDGTTFQPDLDPNATYSWRIREFTAAETGPWSSEWTFSTADYEYETLGPFASFLVTQNAAGPLVEPVYASGDFRGFPGGAPDNRQQVSPARWLIHTVIREDDNSYEHFLSNVLREHTQQTMKSDYELRFTGSSTALDSTHRMVVDALPFELWDIGKDTPEDRSDDIRLIPVVGDTDGDGWGLRAVDHPVSVSLNDPFTDWITWHYPADRSAGEAGYETFASEARTGGNYSDELGMAVLHEIVLVGWNLANLWFDEDLEDIEINPDLPEPGTIFRITMQDPILPVLLSPGPDHIVSSTDKVSFYWLETGADRARLEVSPDPHFESSVAVWEDAEPGVTMNPRDEGSYYWRIRGKMGYSDTSSFVVSASVPNEGTPAIPERFEIGRPYPNPARESVTLPVQGHTAGPILIEVFDVLGRRVTTAEAAGSEPIRLDVSGLAAGVYVLRAEAEGRNWSRTIIVRR